MPIYFQEGVSFRDPAEAESIVRHAFAGTTLEYIYDGNDGTKVLILLLIISLQYTDIRDRKSGFGTTGTPLPTRTGT